MKIIRNDGGFVLIVALLIMVVLTIIGIAATRNTSLELMIAGNDKVHKRTMYQAEAGAVLSTEVLEQNINCITGFDKTGNTADGIDFAELEGTIRVWSQDTDQHPLAMYLNPLPWNTTNCNITNPDKPNISYPISNIGSTELTDSFVGGNAAMLPGGALQMAAGYERKGKSAAGGGTVRVYDIISRHRGLNNSQSTLIFGWRHLVGEESGCNY